MDNNIDTAGYNTPGLQGDERAAIKNSLKLKVKVDRYAPPKESDAEEIDEKKMIESPSQTDKPT